MCGSPQPAEFYEATMPREQMATYDTDHELLPAIVGADRVAWLVRELGLK